MSDTNKKPPLQTFRNQGVTAKIWEQHGPKGAFTTVSIGKSYKDKSSGQYREGHSFTEKDLVILQGMLPQIQHETAKWKAYFNEAEQGHQAEATPRQQPQAQPQPQPERATDDMASKRDAALAQAQQAQPQPAQTQELVAKRLQPEP